MHPVQTATWMLNAAHAIEIMAKPRPSADGEPPQAHPKKPAFDPKDLGEDLRVDMDAAEDLAKRSGQRGGAVGDNPLVPRYVAQIAKKGQKILDFGAGAKAKQTLALRGKGLDVTAFDFHNIPGVHDPDALSRQYDIVFASNVLNTASNKAMLLDGLRKIKKAIKPGGIAIFNYPSAPRYWVTTKYPERQSNTGGVPAQVIAYFVQKTFGQAPTLVGGTNSVPIWQVNG